MVSLSGAISCLCDYIVYKFYTGVIVEWLSTVMWKLSGSNHTHWSAVTGKLHIPLRVEESYGGEGKGDMSCSRKNGPPISTAAMVIQLYIF